MAEELRDLAARRLQAEQEWKLALRGEHQKIIEQLAARRVEKGLTQQQVADAIGCSRGQIANAETGHALVSVETLIGYALAVDARLEVVDQ